MGNVVGFIPIQKDDEEPNNGLEPVVFDFAFVPDAVYCQDAVCPHCKTDEHPELYETIETVDTGRNIKMLGDLMLCLDCTMMYLVVEFPVMPSDVPVMTQWSVFERVYKKN